MHTFPALASLFTNPTKIKRSVLWRALRQESVSGRVTVNPLYTYPRRRFTLSFDVLTHDQAYYDWQTLEDFYNQMNGGGTVFAFNDIYDNLASQQLLGTGDGATTAYQLKRKFPTKSFVEPVTVPQGTPNVFINAVPTGAFSMSTTGLITFNVAPTLGAALTWSGNYLWPCRFDNDNLDFENSILTYFNAAEVSFSTEKII